METNRLAKTKLEILNSGGYRYSFDRQLYFNRGSRKAFSVEFVEDRSEEEISNLVRDDSPSTAWRFFFNKKPSPGVERELATVLG